MKTSELVKMLTKAGCRKERDGHNHDIWYSPITNRRFPVWRHNKEIPTGTLQRILKDAGLK